MNYLDWKGATGRALSSNESQSPVRERALFFRGARKSLLRIKP